MTEAASLSAAGTPFSLPRFSSEGHEICRALFRQVIHIFVEI